MNRRTNHECEHDSRYERREVSAWPLTLGIEPPLAAHLVTPRAFYSHHGIYVGGGRVIHYAGLAGGIRRGPVEEVSLEQFARGRGFCVHRGALASFDPGVVIQRARSRVGENRYRIFSNNCEHFCEWCLRGESRCGQIERWWATPRIATVIVSNGVCNLFSRIGSWASKTQRQPTAEASVPA